MSTENITYRQVVVTDVKDEAPDVKTFILNATDGSYIDYKAGQFLTFVFNTYIKEERRSYSISTSPVIDNRPGITVKRVTNGAYSRYLIDDVRIGDILQTTGAAGLFTLPENISNYKQIFFFAAGIGITPVFSLIKTILHTQPQLQVVLIYSNRAHEQTVFYDELKLLHAQFADRFRVEFLFSTAFNLTRARLSKWLLPVLLKEYTVADKKEMLFYMCGPFAYMRMVMITLEELGIPNENVKKENFDTTRPAKIIMPPDTEAHKVYIHYGEEEHVITCQYPATILQAAHKQSINLPYSCETGRCGSCAAVCTKGKVWLSYNEVLTDADIAAGKVLTCVGYPIEGNVELYL